MARKTKQGGTGGEDARETNGTTSPWFGLYEDSLRHIAAAAAAGAGDTDLALADIIDSAPADMRGSLVERFRSLVQEVSQADIADGPPLTPEQEQELGRMRELERHLSISQWLSEKTLEKIRIAFLLNPALREQVLSIGEQLARRGLFVESGKIRADRLGELQHQAAIDPTKQGGRERDR